MIEVLLHGKVRTPYMWIHVCVYVVTQFTVYVGGSVGGSVLAAVRVLKMQRCAQLCAATCVARTGNDTCWVSTPERVETNSIVCTRIGRGGTAGGGKR